MVIAGANVPDARLLEETIESIVLERPEPEPDYPQHLCLDKGCDNETGRGAIVDYDHEPHIRPIRDERPPRKRRYKPRRWVVEAVAGPECKDQAVAPIGKLILEHYARIAEVDIVSLTLVTGRLELGGITAVEVCPVVLSPAEWREQIAGLSP